MFPVNEMFWVPNCGLIFVPCIAAEAFTSASTILPSIILDDPIIAVSTSQDCTSWSSFSSNALKTCFWLLFKSVW